MIVLTAYVDLLPENIENALAACRTVKRLSLGEPGCERYDFYQGTEDVTKLVFVEEWSTKDHLDVHFQQPAFQQFFAEMGAYLKCPPDIRIFDASLLG